METAVWLGLFLPLIGFLIILSSSYWISRPLTGIVACGSIFLSFLCFLTVFWLYKSPMDFTLFQWIPVNRIQAEMAVHIDPLSIVMTLIITGVGFLIHVYSNGYMEHDEDYARYFGCMNFFVFSMLLLVLAKNLLLLFVGWEGVGLASYLLIGYYYTRPAAANAATKAFVVNRIGDFGFLLGLLLTFYLFGTSDIEQISAQASSVGTQALTLLTFLLFLGAVGKSAQIPLHVWLPDAMEGPTPVSALIHAATMVTAGVYLVVRLHTVYLLAPAALYTVGLIGGITALFASLCALGQNDLKRVLAYSTVSQLGLMFLACGIGAFYAAMFHLTTHAFVKALLFLSAGNVVHMMHGTTDMGKMGGLSSYFPQTHWLFLIGSLALAGIPPLAAFFSKDLILEQEYVAGFYVLFTIALIASALTGFYLMRAYCLTFLGTVKMENKILRAIKEAPYIMLVPVYILAFLSIVGGLLGFSMRHEAPLEDFLDEIGVTLAYPIHGLHLSPEMLMAIIGSFLGVLLSTWIYTRYVDRLGPTFTLLKKSFFIDEIYWALIAVPLMILSKFIAKFLEPKLFDGSITTVTNTTQNTAHLLQRIQSGQIRSYAAWMVLGTVLLLVYFMI